MKKCQHPDCTLTGIAGLCEGHRDLLKREDHAAVICHNCGGLVSVFRKKGSLNTKVKYYFCYQCRNCGGKKEDENVIIKQTF